MGGKERKSKDEKTGLEEMKKQAKEESKKEIKVERGLVRVCETTLDGRLKLRHALLRIKGISHALAAIIPSVATINPEERIGNLTDEQLELIEDVARNPLKYGIPEFLLNRRRDPYDGKSYHLIASDLTITIKQDIERLKKIRCYRGIRHELGLPVRGQRTRSTFRKGKTVGVQRRKK